jgi:hypothetical protein
MDGFLAAYRANEGIQPLLTASAIIPKVFRDPDPTYRLILPHTHELHKNSQLARVSQDRALKNVLDV